MVVTRKSGGKNKSVQRQFSSRLSDASLNGKKNHSGVTTQPKRSHRAADVCNEKSSRKVSSVENASVSVENSDEEQNSNSMIVDSVLDNGCNDHLPSSATQSSVIASSGTGLKPSTRASFQDNCEDDDDEFKSMFMSTVPSFKSRPNCISTPFPRANKHHRFDTNTSNGSPSLHQITSTMRQYPSTSIRDRQPTTSVVRTAKTIIPSTPRISTNTLPSSGTSSFSRSLSIVTQKANNLAVLETFVEYRDLKRELDRALKKNEVWAVDYQSLARRMQKLEQNSFPRPSTDGRVFLEELLEAMKTNDRNEDARTHEDLAADLGFSGTTLSAFSHADPQRTALRLFNAMFPSNEDKEALINVANMAATRSQLLQDILIFARRCAPGSGYTITMLKEAIGNSIRCARHKLKRNNAQVIAATVIGQPVVIDGVDDAEEDLSQSDEVF